MHRAKVIERPPGPCRPGATLAEPPRPPDLPLTRSLAHVPIVLSRRPVHDGGMTTDQADGVLTAPDQPTGTLTAASQPTSTLTAATLP